MRATSALMNTIAVTISSSPPIAVATALKHSHASPYGGAERAHPAPSLAGGVVLFVGAGVVQPVQVPAGAADRAGPRAFHLDQPDAGGVEPAQHDLDLLGRGGGDGSDARQHRLRRGAQHLPILPRVGAARADPGGREPAVPDHVQLPAAVLGPLGGAD